MPLMRCPLRSLLLRQPRPAWMRILFRAGEGQLPRRGVLGERGSGAECRAPAYAHRRDELGVRAYENVVLDDGAVLVCSVIVVQDSARDDVVVYSHIDVADLCEVCCIEAIYY